MRVRVLETVDDGLRDGASDRGAGDRVKTHAEAALTPPPFCFGVATPLTQKAAPGLRLALAARALSRHHPLPSGSESLHSSSQATVNPDSQG